VVLNESGWGRALAGIEPYEQATHCLADFMRELKKASSAWAHNLIGVSRFAWQEGYAAFTVSATARPSVQRYIANQELHHLKRTFRESTNPGSRAPPANSWQAFQPA
jgi:Transposase IS200 like